MRALSVLYLTVVSINGLSKYFLKTVTPINFYLCLLYDESPSQAVCIKLEIFNVLACFKDLRMLEKVFSARHLLFKKVLKIPREEFKKIKGTIRNVPLVSPDVLVELPRGNDFNSVAILKFKRKLGYKGSVYYDSVKPAVLLEYPFIFESTPPLVL